MASTLQIGSVAFPPGQCTSPHLHPCHRLFDQDGHQQSSSASLSSRPCSCDFCLFSKLRGCCYETIGEMKEACDEGPWHLHTRGLKWGLPEVVWTVQQVHCSRRRLLGRGLEFHVCTINKSAIRKKSENIFNDPCMNLKWPIWQNSLVKTVWRDYIHKAHKIFH